LKRVILAAVFILLAACATRPQAPQTTQSAPQLITNGEIFDPMLMTASHRTLPFGTLLDVRNPTTNQTVRVRINERGPYVGDRLIDLSYAAAKQLGLVDSGGGEVELALVTVGRGEHEPPVPFAVDVPDTIPVAATSSPVPAAAQPQPAPAPVTVENVQVIEQHGGVETRRQVAANGTSIVDVPVNGTSVAPAAPPAGLAPTTKPTSEAAGATPKPLTGRFVVQVGAFSQEANARALQQKLAAIGQSATIDHTSLFHVMLGPFDKRDQAVGVRSKLEAAGISAIIVTQ